MLSGEVEETFYPRNPLDLLAQQIVAMVSRETLDVDELYAMIRGAAPYADLPRSSFEGVLDLLAGRYPSDEFAELRRRINWDRIAGTISPRRGTQSLAILNGGTIPDRGLYGVFLVGDGPNGTGGSRVGELDEEMVFETHAGEVFLLGASSWRVLEITRDRVLVAPAPGEPGRMPFWRGDAASERIERHLSDELESDEAGDASDEEQGLVISPEIPRQIPTEGKPARSKPAALGSQPRGDREEEVVPMSPIRRRIAERLVEAQQTAALLTTFNEIDMTAVMALRKEHKAIFEQRYGIKLGFMSFFVKASIDALKFVPQVNAEIRDTDIVYRNYYDIGIAVGGGKGLVVPILRDADRMSFAEIELAIADLASRARENKLELEELQGGTFTISNGGIYGSMLSTPIVNPPQSGILGLHAFRIARWPATVRL